MSPTRPKIVVIGSLNIDYIASVERLPAPGETVAANGLIQRFGGKGANQAVAAARQGANVSMIGCVGTDAHGRAYRRRLAQEGINGRGLSSTDRALTGTALIAVDHSAENIIVVAPGANEQLNPAAIRKCSSMIRPSGILLLQFEIPMSTAIEVVRLAQPAGATVILNPSPFRAGFAWGRWPIETLIVNELEAEAIFAMPARTVNRELDKWRDGLAQKRIERLVITRGSRPTVCIDAYNYLEVPALKVNPVDTVGAGDAFAGVFAARRADGLDVKSAIGYANCAGALATLKAGAQESIPSRAATERAFRQLRQQFG